MGADQQMHIGCFGMTNLFCCLCVKALAVQLPSFDICPHMADCLYQDKEEIVTCLAKFTHYVRKKPGSKLHLELRNKKKQSRFKGYYNMNRWSLFTFPKQVTEPSFQTMAQSSFVSADLCVKVGFWELLLLCSETEWKQINTPFSMFISCACSSGAINRRSQKSHGLIWKSPKWLYLTNSLLPTEILDICWQLSFCVIAEV